MQVPQGAIDIAKSFEGLRLKPYICPAGYPTIGYGHVISSLNHPAISEEEAVDFLRKDFLIATRGAIRMCPSLAQDNEQRLAAISDFCFNLGVGRLQASTLRRRINQNKWDEAIKELRRWVRGGGRVLPGLVLRREAEINLIKQTL